MTAKFTIPSSRDTVSEVARRSGRFHRVFNYDLTSRVRSDNFYNAIRVGKNVNIFGENFFFSIKRNGCAGGFIKI